MTLPSSAAKRAALTPVVPRSIPRSACMEFSRSALDEAARGGGIEDMQVRDIHTQRSAVARRDTGARIYPRDDTWPQGNRSGGVRRLARLGCGLRQDRAGHL